MFDAGFWEIFLITVITLIVVGPDKMPGLARSAGRIIGKIKRFMLDAKMDLDNQINTEEIKQGLNFDEDKKILEIVEENNKDINNSLKDEQ